MSEGLKEALSLRQIDSETLVIKAFGSADVMIQTCDNVHVPVNCAPLCKHCIEFSRE